MHGKNDKRVVVYLATEHIYHSCKMLARHSPVGTGTLHVEVLPRFGENVEVDASGNIQYLGTEFPVEKTGQNIGVFQNLVYQLVNLFLRKEAL